MSKRRPESDLPRDESKGKSPWTRRLEGRGFFDVPLEGEAFDALALPAELSAELCAEMDAAYDAAIDRALAKVQGLLERCQALRFDNPRKRVDLALLATLAAGQLSPKRYDPRQIADCQCRAWIELGNAYRVADKLDDAAVALDQAAELLHEGTGDEGLEARLHDVQTSLHLESWARGSA